MGIITQISAAILSSGWLISGLLFAQQYWHIRKKKKLHGVSWITFAGFCVLQLNVMLYALLNAQWYWLPGAVIAAIACALIAYKAYTANQS